MADVHLLVQDGLARTLRILNAERLEVVALLVVKRFQDWGLNWAGAEYDPLNRAGLRVFTVAQTGEKKSWSPNKAAKSSPQ